MSFPDTVPPLQRGPDLLGLPPQDRRLRIGLVGGGRIAKVQSMAMRLSDRWDIVAGVFSSDAKASHEKGREWHLPANRVYASYEEMAERETARPDGIEAVAITTPNDNHHHAVCTFVDAGIDVFCEKPLTTTLDDAVDLVKRVRRSGLVFCLAHAYAAHAMVRQAKAIVAIPASSAASARCMSNTRRNGCLRKRSSRCGTCVGGKTQPAPARPPAQPTSARMRITSPASLPASR